MTQAEDIAGVDQYRAHMQDCIEENYVFFSFLAVVDWQCSTQRERRLHDFLGELMKKVKYSIPTRSR